MKIVCISDTHNRQDRIQIPDCDLILHCGDYSWRGKENETIEFFKWFSQLPATHKVMIPGNHDFIFENHLDVALQLANLYAPNVTILLNTRTEIVHNSKTYSIHGFHYTPRYHDWAFNVDRNKMKPYLDVIEPCDILISHGPPFGLGDKVKYDNDHFAATHNGKVGCQDMLEMLSRVSPSLHVFGHIHEAYGIYKTDLFRETTFINAAIYNHYDSANLNKPILIEIY